MVKILSKIGLFSLIISEQYKLLCTLVSKNPVGVFLSAVDANKTIFKNLYINDFVNNMYCCCQQSKVYGTMEYEVKWYLILPHAFKS